MKSNLVFAITSTAPSSHRDALMIVSANSKQEALERVIYETTILDVINENNIELTLLPVTANADRFIAIFADDIECISVTN